MSLARKCNRCGAFFDPLDTEGRMARFCNPIFQTSNDIREQVRGAILFEEAGPEGIIDLCPNCSELFREFMNPALTLTEAVDNVNKSLDRFAEKLQAIGGKRRKPIPTFPKEEDPEE